MPGPFNPPGTAQDVNVTFDPGDIINVRVRNGNNTAYIEPAQENGNLSDIKVNTDNIPVLGQTTMAGSTPVTIASDQSDLPINLKQVNGTTISVNTGPTGNGSPRVTVAIDSATVAGSASLPAGTNAIGKLAANDGVDIGDVTVNNAAGAAAVNIQDGGNSITVDGPLTDSQLRATPVPVSAASLPLPTGAATEAKQTQPGVDIGDVTVNNAAGAGAVNIQDGGNSITIDATSLPLPTGAATEAKQTQPGVDIGDVTVNNGAGAGAVNIQDGGNSITVDGPLTDAQLRATAVPVSGPLTDAQLRATPVPVSGTVTATPTGTQDVNLMEVGGSPFDIGTQLAAASVSTTTASDEAVPVGQAPMSDSVPVTMASDQSEIPVSQGSPGGAAWPVDVQTTKVILSKTDLATDTTAILGDAASSRYKIHAFSLTTLSNAPVVCQFVSQTSATVLWTVVLQAPSGGMAGANLSTAIPGWLFAADFGDKMQLVMDVPTNVYWAISYVDEP